MYNTIVVVPDTHTKCVEESTFAAARSDVLRVAMVSVSHKTGAYRGLCVVVVFRFLLVFDPLLGGVSNLEPRLTERGRLDGSFSRSEIMPARFSAGFYRDESMPHLISVLASKRFQSLLENVESLDPHSSFWMRLFPRQLRPSSSAPSRLYECLFCSQRDTRPCTCHYRLHKYLLVVLELPTVMVQGQVN